MKKLIILVLLVLPSVAFASFDTNLKYGAKGDAVLELQEFLTDQGVYSGPITGNFYSLTRTAIKKFQTLYGIEPAAGYFGPLTRMKANELLSKENQKESSQEIQETNTTTPPLVQFQPAPVIPTPTPTPAPIVAPAPTPAPSVPTRLYARSRDFSKNSYPEVAGANCEPMDYWVSVYDQYGVEMDAQDVTITSPFLTATEKTRQEDYTRAKIHAFFRYYTPATSTTEAITFTSGKLSASSVLHVREGLKPHQIMQDPGNGRWYEKGGGALVDPLTLSCL